MVVNNGNKNGEKVVIKGEICTKPTKPYDIHCFEKQENTFCENDFRINFHVVTE